MSSKQKILIVEDDPVIVISLEFLLQQQGYDILVASDGEQALQIVEEKNPHLIVMDVMLPKKTGLEVCSILKSSEDFDQLPVLLLTAKGRDVDLQQGEKVGADAYLTKPFSNRVLVERIQQLLNPSS